MELTNKQIEDLALFEACTHGCIGMIRYIKKKQDLPLSCLREGFIAAVKYNKNYSPENYRKMLDKIGKDFGLETEESLNAEVYYFLAILAEKGIREGKSSFNE